MGDVSDIGVGPKYLALLQKIANREQTTLYIDLDDLRLYEENEADNIHLVDLIYKNAHHYTELFSNVIDEIMPEPTEDITYKDDVLDVILHQRRLRNLRLEQENMDELNAGGFAAGNQEAANNAADELAHKNAFPPKLTRRYFLYFKPLTDLYKGNGKALSVREVKGAQLGHLVTIRGIVTRVSDVKPSVQVNAYTCDKCGYEIFQEINSRNFTPLTECPSSECKANRSKGQLFMSTRASKFSAFQDVKMQELSHQVPIGHIPRSLDIHVNGDLVRSMNPGDVVDITGVFLPLPYTGFKAIRAGLLTETYLEAQYIRQHKKKYENVEVTGNVEQLIEKLRSEGNMYEHLAKSISPEIYGHEDVKKALLLLLVGGVTKEMGDGMRIRGDINICLMGDPGVAKSQLLKSISKIAPRGVYTTGRGSSGVGLTAAVMRDPVTDEMVLEGGALVLADNGICCIDEFDKMADADRTAIHEVMEQQTISISKGGITTTLNARTSVLAAANPLWGRYNPKVSPVENINLPAALLSRFDIMFLILDTPSIESDTRLAQHVSYVHMHNEHPPMEFEPLDPSTMRQIIAYARQLRPVVPKSVGDYIVASYIRMRQEQKRTEGSTKQFTHVTARTLLGILRMTQALSRLRCSETVTLEDVDEALRLINASKVSLYQQENGKSTKTISLSSQIYNIIRNLAMGDGSLFRQTLKMKTIRDRIYSRGFTDKHLRDCLEEYSLLGVWQIIDNNDKLVFIDTEGLNEEDIDEADLDMD